MLLFFSISKFNALMQIFFFVGYYIAVERTYN